MDRFPPSADGPHFEMASIGRTLDDLLPGDMIAPRPGGVIAPVAWSVLGSVALIAFVGWLLVA